MVDDKRERMEILRLFLLQDGRLPPSRCFLDRFAVDAESSSNCSHAEALLAYNEKMSMNSSNEIMTLPLGD